MMAAGDIETFYQNGMWFNRIEGESRTLGPGFDTREKAVVTGRSAAVARQVEHTVKGGDAPSDDRRSHGTHPRELFG